MFKYVLLFLLSIGSGNASDYSLIGDFDSIVSNGGSDYVEVSEYRFSFDGKYLAAMEGVIDFEEREKRQPIVLTVRESNTNEIINATTLFYDLNVLTNTRYFNFMFSPDGSSLVVGMPVGEKNLIWKYKNEAFPKETCFSYMGSTIQGVSESGKLFAASTEDGVNYICDTSKEPSELLFYNPLPDLPAGMDNLIKVVGFFEDAVVVSSSVKGILNKDKMRVWAKEITFKIVSFEDLDENIDNKFIALKFSNEFNSELKKLSNGGVLNTDNYIFKQGSCDEGGGFMKKKGEDKFEALNGGVITVSSNERSFLLCRGSTKYLYTLTAVPLKN